MSCLMKSYSRSCLAVFCLFTLATPAFGQWRNRGRGYSRINVDRLIRQAENRSDQFVRMFSRVLDQSPFEGTRREDRLNDRALELERQLNIVRQEFDRTNNQYGVRSHIANAIDIAQGINTVMRNRRMNPGVERQWILLRSDLNRLAAVYNVRQLR